MSYLVEIVLLLLEKREGPGKEQKSETYLFQTGQ